MTLLKNIINFSDNQILIPNLNKNHKIQIIYLKNKENYKNNKKYQKNIISHCLNNMQLLIYQSIKQEKLDVDGEHRNK
jgi:hypothetical protein